MIIKDVVMEDFINYKKPSMFIAFPKCSFKCDKECGKQVCQNGALANSPDICVSINTIVEAYMNNPITSAVVCGGLEPMDSWNSLQLLILELRYYTTDDIVIYTGYTEEEIGEEKLKWLKLYAMDGDIIVKFGRFIPNDTPHYDEILGVQLASSNQYAVRFGK